MYLYELMQRGLIARDCYIACLVGMVCILIVWLEIFALLLTGKVVIEPKKTIRKIIRGRKNEFKKHN